VLGVSELPVVPRRQSGVRPWRVLAAAAVALTAVVTTLAVRHHDRPMAFSAPTVVTPMPISAAIEDRFGVRFNSVNLIAGHGMIQVRYLVLDASKALALHEEATTPFIITGDGKRFDAPGIPGHNHSKSNPDAGTAGYTLLANTNTGVRSGMRVTLSVGGLTIRNVEVL
jgi:hypothetical protein